MDVSTKLLVFFTIVSIIFLVYAHADMSKTIQKIYTSLEAANEPESLQETEDLEEIQPNSIILPFNFSDYQIILSSRIESMPEYNIESMEKNVHELINRERALQGLNELKWNDYVASVAREHSYNLALENRKITDFNLRCSVPIIHHEGLDFGLYHNDRLYNRSIYYFSASAENIFLGPVSKSKFYRSFRTITCEHEFNSEYQSDESEEEIIQDIKNELQERRDFVEEKGKVNWVSVTWKDQSDIEEEMVNGWMSSPGHRKNILAEGFDETGIGIVGVNEYVISTQIFIKRVSCGYKTGPCCEKKGYYPHCYIPLKCEKGICVE